MSVRWRETARCPSEVPRHAPRKITADSPLPNHSFRSFDSSVKSREIEAGGCSSHREAAARDPDPNRTGRASMTLNLPSRP